MPARCVSCSALLFPSLLSISWIPHCLLPSLAAAQSPRRSCLCGPEYVTEVSIPLMTQLDFSPSTSSSSSKKRPSTLTAQHRRHASRYPILSAKIQPCRNHPAIVSRLRPCRPPAKLCWNRLSQMMCISEGDVPPPMDLEMTIMTANRHIPQLSPAAAKNSRCRGGGGGED